jgi:CubicO group peptidase (beta-lactamase class C family)
LPRSDDWYFKDYTSRKDVVAAMANIKLTAAPGKLWQYNNQNFVLAGYLVEQVTGQSWEDYTRQHVFEPLGMQSAIFDVAQMQKSSDYADPHSLDVLKGMQPIPFFTKLAPIGPAGSIIANVTDMSKYALYQLANVAPASGQALLPANLFEQMHTQQIAISRMLKSEATPSASSTTSAPAGTTTPSASVDASANTQQDTPAQTSAIGGLTTDTGYAMGWLTENYRGYRLVQHDGAIDGFTASLTLIPDSKDAIVLLTNALMPTKPILSWK